MENRHQVRLGAVPETLFIPLAARAMRRELPARHPYLTPLADPLLGKAMTITLFRASCPGAAG